MIPTRTAVLLGLLLIGSCVVAQNAVQPVRLRLFLPPYVDSEKIEIAYVLYGAFGANGNSINPSPYSSSVEIPLTVGGKSAEEFKAFAWAPGCRTQTFDIQVKGVDVQETYSCEPLPPVLFRGQIKQSKLFRNEGTEINVDYLAAWACEFFDSADCMVPQFSVATTTADRTGHFEIEVPDFASDPACIQSALPSGFRFTLREIKTLNHVAYLNPQSKSLRAPTGELKPQSEYPNPTMFIAEKPR